MELIMTLATTPATRFFIKPRFVKCISSRFVSAVPTLGKSPRAPEVFHVAERRYRPSICLTSCELPPHERRPARLLARQL
jgi:hypothetical protein